MDAYLKHRIEALEREVLALRQQMPRVPERFGGSRAPLQVRLATTAAEDGGTYPESSTNATKYGIIFLDGTFNALASGTEAPTYTNRQADAMAFAMAGFGPPYIPPDTVVAVMLHNDRWWILQIVGQYGMGVYYRDQINTTSYTGTTKTTLTWYSNQVSGDVAAGTNGPKTTTKARYAIDLSLSLYVFDAGGGYFDVYLEKNGGTLAVQRTWTTSGIGAGSAMTWCDTLVKDDVVTVAIKGSAAGDDYRDIHGTLRMVRIP